MEKLLGWMQMKIHEIDIKNFRGYGENVDEEDGFYKFKDLDQSDIVLITGHNGYGKTSLYEAIEWCITDNIKSLKKHTEEVNRKPTLKKSHYLKFQSTYDEREREVAVRIIFDNGKTLMRKTNCDSLQQEEYSSIVVDDAGAVWEEEAINEFIKNETGQPINKFFRLSFCGQAYSEDLVYDTSASSRGDILLSFLGMDTINDIISKSDGKSNNFLNKRQTKVQENIDNGNQIKEKLDELFQVNNWGSIQEFQRLVSDKIDVANHFQKDLKELNIAEEFLFKKETITEIAETLNKSRLLKERFEQARKEDVKQKREIVKRRLIYEYKKNEVFLSKLDMMLKVNISQLQEELSNFLLKEKSYENTIEELKKRKIEIDSYYIQSQEDKGEVLFLTEVVVRKYEKEKELYEKLYSESQKYGLSLKEQSILFNIRRLLYYSDVYRNRIEKDDEVLNEKKNNIQKLEGISDRRKDMLLKVQSYVNQSEIIDKCPVCGGTEFIQEGDDTKAKLLNIIGNEIADGDEDIRSCNADIVSFETQMKRVRESYERNVGQRFLEGIKNLENAINECIEEISQYLQGMIDCNDKVRNVVHIKCADLEKKVERYNNFLVEYSNDESILREKITQMERLNLKIGSLLSDKFEILPDAIELVEERKKGEVRLLIRKIHQEQKVIKVLNDILKYDIGKENLELLEKYEEINTNTEGLENKNRLYKEALRFRKNVNENAKKIQAEMIETYIQDNELINFMYQFINPHPFFRNFKIVHSKTETNIKYADKDDIYLDHVFSEAQMKVLSLSIFLGLNLSVKNNCFEQIYIDDPVQSMDDINMVSFIDLLRALKSSKNIKKNFVIGTHDANFSKLLKIKFRHRSFIEYHIEAYSKEGPVVKIKRN